MRALSGVNVDALIIGGGAAGTYCAIHAAARGLRVAILEKNPDIGAKIRVSGGGRCNMTNRDIAPHAYLSHNPNFCRSALARHSQWDFLAWCEAAGLSYEEKTLGQLFCRQKSRGLIAALQEALDAAQIPVYTDTCVDSIRRDGQDFCLHTSQGVFRAPQIVLACGGPSFAKLGASDHALGFAKSLGIANFPFRPALVPFTLTEAMPQLAGLSCRVSLRTAQSPTFTEQLLFTHRGLSGPAILQVSSYWQKGETVHLNFLPDCPADALEQAKAQHSPQSLTQWLKQHLPNALAQHLAAPYPQRPIAELADKQIQAISQALQDYRLIPSGTEGMKKAEVSTGGIDTRALDPRTMAVKSQPGMFVIGEALDVTGWLGGYNFQWAWSSAWCCAQALNKHL